MMRPHPPLKSFLGHVLCTAVAISTLSLGTSAIAQLSNADSRAPVAGPDKQAVERIALEEMTEQDIERVNGQPLIARKPLPKTNQLIKPTSYDARLIVKFVDDMKARPLDDGMIFSRSRQSTFEVDLLARRYGAVFNSPFRKLKEGDLNRIRAKAALNSGKAQPDLAGMMYVEAPDGFMEPLAKELQALDCVEWVAFETKPEPHGYVNTSPPAATLAASTMAPLGGANGACCVGAGCIDTVNQTECEAIGGNFRGENTSCAQDTCIGACCFPQGDPQGRTCEVLTNADCDTEGGTFRQNTIGDPLACNNGDPCLGRGCDFAGNCTDGQSWAAPGTDFEFGVTCQQSPCPPPPGAGACCIPTDEPLEDAECEETVSGGCPPTAVFLAGLTCDVALCDTGACTTDFLNQSPQNTTVTTLEACAASYDPITAPNPSFAGFGHSEQTQVFQNQITGLWGSCCIGGGSCLIVGGFDVEECRETCAAIGELLQTPSFWTAPEWDNNAQDLVPTQCTLNIALPNDPPEPAPRCSVPGICAIEGQGCDPTTNLATCVTGFGGVFVEHRDQFGIFPPLPPCLEPLGSLSGPGFEVAFGTCCNQNPRVDPSNVAAASGTTGGCLDQGNPRFGAPPLTPVIQPYYTYVEGDEFPDGIPKIVCDSLGYPWELIFTTSQAECQPGNATCLWDSGNFPCGYDLFWGSWTDLTPQPPFDQWPNPQLQIIQTPTQRYQGPCHQALTFYNCWDYEDTTTPGVECCDIVVGLYAGCGGNPDPGTAGETWNLFCTSLAMTVCGPTGGPSIDPVQDPPIFECPVVYAGLGLTRPNSANTWGYCPCIGSVLAGPCEQPNGSHGCEDPQCCTTVCQLEGFGYCCSAGWDSGCAEMASIMCARTREEDNVELYRPIPRCNDPMCADYDTPDFTEGQGYLTPIPYGYRKSYYGGLPDPEFPILAFPTPTLVQPEIGGFLETCNGFPSGIPGYMGQGLSLEEWRKKNVDPFWYKWAGLYGIGAEFQQEYGRDLASTDGTIYNRTRGLGVRVGVIDYSYTEMHEDLNVTLEPDVTMQILPEPYGPSHGTAVLGIINAIDQTRPNPGLPNNDQPNNLEQIGVVGIAPEAEALFFPLVSIEDGPRELEAWTNAINTLSLGDVLCIPYGPTGGGGCNNTVEPLWQLAQVATDLGITVVMSAGNAHVDLSQQEDFGDNGCIVTGASTPGGAISGAGDELPPWDPDVTQGAIPLYFSNYNSIEPTGAGDPSATVAGNQISINMWGRNVYTTGGLSPPINLNFDEDFPTGISQDCYNAADPYPSPPNWNPAQKAESNVAYGTRIPERAYSNDFGGTSAGAAMVAAVACGMQGFHNQYYGTDASPQQIRAAMTATALANSDPLIVTAAEGQFYGFGTPRPRDACLSLITQSGLAYDDSPWLDELYILTGDLVSGNIFSIKGDADNNFLIVRTNRAHGSVSTGQPYPFDEVSYPARGPITDIGVVVDSDANRFSSAVINVVLVPPAVRTAFFTYIFNPNTDRWDYLDYQLLSDPEDDDDGDDDGTEAFDIEILNVNNYIQDGDLRIRFWSYQVDFGGNGLSQGPGFGSSDDPHPSDYSLMRYEFIGFEIENGGAGDGNGSILSPLGGNSGGGGGGQPLGG